MTHFDINYRVDETVCVCL